MSPCDIRMQEMSGLEAANAITQTQSIPVIVDSSYERPAGVDAAFIAAFLLKPVNQSDLKTAIAKACNAG